MGLHPFDLAVVGSGFAGSLIALIAKKLGRSVVLIERGRHPRFVIGESSTPLANLILEELANRYDLPGIATLSKWGTWQRHHSDIACGLKRGFTFYHHEFGKVFEPRSDRSNELMVAASPHDAIADTHWYRPEFDVFLAQTAQKFGVEYFDEVALQHADFTGNLAELTGRRHEKSFSVRAKFIVDATGPHGFLHRALGLPETPLPGFPGTRSLYTHFREVGRFEDLRHQLEAQNEMFASDWPANRAEARKRSPDVPYPPDDAALHHIFPGGWIWVLRFNNGITSAGAAMTDALANTLDPVNGDRAWEQLLDRLPSVRAQFRRAKPTMEFMRHRRLSFRSGQVTGQNWALLPSAAGFVDPLLSTGFPLTLLGVERLARLFEEGWEKPDFGHTLDDYGRRTNSELETAADLIAALYANMDNFPSFTALSLLYFAAASYSEAARRLGRKDLASSFLLREHSVFGPALKTSCELASLRTSSGRLGESVNLELNRRVMNAIAPFDVAGLTDQARRNWFPARADDLLAGASKLCVDQADIKQLLIRCGFEARF